MAASKSFVVGDTVKFKATIYVDDVLTNPTTVTFLVEEPSGDDEDITESSATTGIHTGSFATVETGWHTIKMTGAGNSADFVRERKFYVATSDLVVD